MYEHVMVKTLSGAFNDILGGNVYNVILHVKGLVNLQKDFFKLLLIEKPVMRETECRKPHQKFKIDTKL